jgi:DNA-directed RNA polymerase subunit RPC12/RpoP
MDKELLEKYCNDGLTIRAISKNENISSTAIRYWLKKFGLKTRGWSNIDKNELIDAVKESKSYNEVFVKLHRASTSSNYNLLKRLILKFNIDVAHFLNRSELTKRTYLQKEIAVEDILVAESKTSRGTIKKIILKNNLLEYICSECGQNEWWFGKKMTLILDHKNGIRNDHRLSNLRFVCPNCNSTLPTHCRKHKTHS